VIILDVALAASVFDLVERRLRNIDVASLEQFGHLPVEECEQQGADV